MSDERRRALRLKAYRPIRLQPASTPHVVETLTKDLAAGGVRCVSPTVFPVSTELSVELHVANGQEPFTLRREAVWFQSIPGSEQFEVGIAFKDIPPRTLRRLSVCLEDLSLKNSPPSIQ